MIKHTPATPLPWEPFCCSLYQADNWQHGNNLGGQRVGQTYIEDSDDMPTKAEEENAAYIVHTANAYPKSIRDLNRIAFEDLSAEQMRRIARALLRSLGELQ